MFRALAHALVDEKGWLRSVREAEEGAGGRAVPAPHGLPPAVPCWADPGRIPRSFWLSFFLHILSFPPESCQLSELGCAVILVFKIPLPLLALKIEEIR